ncbi:L,D-transpeptidase [Psychroserpens sp.]|uniref:L,D-transpeptidase n=1 Tax=Psychroserpens sp. TaxID=2020870 RepID=UPI00385CAE33
MVTVHQHIIIVALFIFVLKFSFTQSDYFDEVSDSTKLSSQLASDTLLVKNHVLIENYFQYIDSLVIKHDSLTPYKLNEHLLVHANSWIIDTLQNTDYYRMMSRDSFVYDQKKMIVLPKGSVITIPDSIRAKKISSAFQKTKIDINIPEFKLRIYQDSILLYEFPIRVGRNEKKYLEMSGRIQDLKTKTGVGYIVNYNRNPRYVNPVNNHQYFVTKRDDKKVTKLPQIPFIETEINGIRNGQLIHSTTNPITLGKSYSNGCIGTKEADAWVIYYFAPLHTNIKIRYDLNIINELGETIVLENIYQYK